MFYVILTEAEIGLLRALVGDYQRRLILDMRDPHFPDEGRARYRSDIDEAGWVAERLAEYRQDIRPAVSVLIRDTERLAELLQNDLAPISKDSVHAARSAIRALRDRGVD
jgi:hypothetical protein